MDLNRPVPEPVVREIAINSAKKKAVSSRTIDMTVDAENGADAVEDKSRKA